MADESLPPSRPPSRKDGGSGASSNPYALMGVGLVMAGAVALFTVAGWWLDEKFGTSPGFLLLGLVLGMVGGFRHLWHQAKIHSDD